MKTVVSIPDTVFRSADQAAKRMRISRSQLYATAVAAYVKRLGGARITEKLNEVYADAAASRMDAALAAAQSRALGSERW